MIERHGIDERPTDEPGEITRWLREWGDGEPAALDRLMPWLYGELRRIARALAAGERREHTLQPTAVVHEAWIQLVGPRGVQTTELVWRNRSHFLGVAARAMRRVLVDYARRRLRAKRGGGLSREPLADALAPSRPPAEEVLALHFALERLESFAPLEARVVELRFFGGLTVNETADYVGLSPRTVARVRRRAGAWLRSELGAEAAL